MNVLFLGEFGTKVRNLMKILKVYVGASGWMVNLNYSEVLFSHNVPQDTYGSF